MREMAREYVEVGEVGAVRNRKYVVRKQILLYHILEQYALRRVVISMHCAEFISMASLLSRRPSDGISMVISGILAYQFCK